MNDFLSEKDAKAVLEILVEQLGVEESQLAAAARLQEDLGADSLTLTEIVLTLEEQLNISIPDETAEKVSTVGDIFEMLAGLLAERPAKP
jgi:acyl carrier protein